MIFYIFLLILPVFFFFLVFRSTMTTLYSTKSVIATPFITNNSHPHSHHHHHRINGRNHSPQPQSLSSLKFASPPRSSHHHFASPASSNKRSSSLTSLFLPIQDQNSKLPSTSSSCCSYSSFSSSSSSSSSCSTFLSPSCGGIKASSSLPNLLSESPNIGDDHRAKLIAAHCESNKTIKNCNNNNNNNQENTSQDNMVSATATTAFATRESFRRRHRATSLSLSSASSSSSPEMIINHTDKSDDADVVSGNATDDDDNNKDIDKNVLEKLLEPYYSPPRPETATSGAATPISGAATPTLSQPDTPTTAVSNDRRRRKNSSMTPVVPDLELMARLRREDEEAEEKAKSKTEETSQKPANIAAAAADELDVKSTIFDCSGDKGNNDNKAQMDNYGATKNRIPEWGEAASDNETAAVWLAAALTAQSNVATGGSCHSPASSPQMHRRQNGFKLALAAAAVVASAAVTTTPSDNFQTNESERKTNSAEIEKTKCNRSSPIEQSLNDRLSRTTSLDTIAPKTNHSTSQSETINRDNSNDNDDDGGERQKGAIQNNVTDLLRNNRKQESTPHSQPKQLLPFGEDTRIRRTSSILRPPTSYVAVAAAAATIPGAGKKKVSFADAAGKQLESIRYFATLSPQLTRRYSSYVSPTYLSNGNYNSPWNLAINGNCGGGGGKTENNNHHQNNNHNYYPQRWQQSSFDDRFANRTPSWLSQIPASYHHHHQGFDTTLSSNIHNSIIAAPIIDSFKVTPTTTTTATTTITNITNPATITGALSSQQRYELVASNFAANQSAINLHFTAMLQSKSILLHSVTTAETTVYGTVAVVNLHFDKRVTVRYTFNEWQTFVEREATYMLGSHDGFSDKFAFVIYARFDDFATSSSNDTSDPARSTAISTTAAAAALPVRKLSPPFRRTTTSIGGNSRNEIVTNRLHFALRFCTGDGREFWDNNDGRNYCLDLTAY